jgi:polysaccharide biosynthesis transport protein
MAAVKSPTIADYLGMLLRRRKLALVVFAAVAVLFVIAAFVWPATYRSTATILIEQQEVPTDLVRSTISSYADQRIQVISQRVMTTANLIGIIQKYNLYPRERRTQPREAVIDRMRADVSFQMISADVMDPRLGHPTKATIAFSVSYSSRSAELAARVANELTTLYLDENLRSRKQLSADTTTFLTAEVGRLTTQIGALEGKLAAFKESHGQDLPELAQVNIQLRTHAEDEMRELDSRIRSLDQQIVYLDAQLAQLAPASQIYASTGERVMSASDRLKYLRSDYARLAAIYAPDHPDVVRTKREIDGLEGQLGAVDVGNDLGRKLQDAKSQLAQAEQRYSPDHPDVVRLQATVKGIEASLQNDAANGATPAVSTKKKDDADNPAYIQIRAQREASINEKKSLEIRRTQAQSKLNDLEKRMEQAPTVEKEYSAMVRELENDQLQYRETRQKQMDAELAQSLEVERKGERFTLIEPPLVPEKPQSPNRFAIVFLGFALGLAGGVASVALSESLDRSVRGRRDLEDLLTVPPLAIVPWIETSADRAKHRSFRRLTLAGVATSLVAAVVMVHFLYRPLDVLWQMTLRRLGG